jgi:ketosteroid isomerase-like protein
VSENVEIVREVLAAWPRGDRDAIVAAMAEDCELVPLRAQLEGSSYRGREGALRFWDDLHADWEGLELPIQDVRDLGDTVVVIGHLVARGRTSGVDLDVPIGQVWELRDGKVTRMHAFSDPADALRAAGLDA